VFDGRVRQAPGPGVEGWQVAVVTTVILLAATMALPDLRDGLGGLGLAVAVPVAVVFLAATAALRRENGERENRERPTATGRERARSALEVVLHLWPVGVLTVIYPIASRDMAGYEVGGVALTSLLLAVSLTVPWLSQGVCMPLYMALGTDGVRSSRQHVDSMVKL